MNVWCVRANFGEYADEFRIGGYVGLDYGIDEPYVVGKGRDAFIEQYKKYHPDDTSNVVIGQQVGQITRFCEEMKIGDYVITPSKNTDVLYYGTLLEDYIPNRDFLSKTTDNCPYKHRRKVSWNNGTVARAHFSVPLQNTLRSSLTVFNISQASEFLTTINATGYKLPQDTPTYNPYESVIKQVLELHHSEFEILVSCLLTAIGFEDIKVTGGPWDSGLDVTGTLNVYNFARVEVCVQAKRYAQNKRINGIEVKKLRGATPDNALGAIITTADFHKKAYETAVEPGFKRIGLINGLQLVDLLVEHWKDIPQEFQSKLGLKIGLIKN